VKRPPSDRLVLDPEDVRRPGDHLLGRTPGEREEKDRLRPDPRLDELHQTMDERVSLPRPRARDDEDGAFENLGRLTLRLVQGFQSFAHELKTLSCRNLASPIFVQLHMRGLKLALRSLLRAPGFTLVAVVTLGLGIGANTAIFTVIQGVLLDPLPYDDSDRLVRFWNTWTRFPRGSISEAEDLDFLEENRPPAKARSPLRRT